MSDLAESVELGPEQLAVHLEAVCFALNRPLTFGEAGAILGRSAADVREAADVLASVLAGRGLMLQRHNDELQLVTRADAAWAVQRALNPERPGRLSRPAMETLAIVAYRQPVTRAGIEGIRGVNCEAVLDSLERRELIEEVGRQETPGHPRLYGTTLRFLQVVGLESIDRLPSLAPGEEPAVTAARLGLENEERGGAEDQERGSAEGDVPHRAEGVAPPVTALAADPPSAAASLP